MISSCPTPANASLSLGLTTTGKVVEVSGTGQWTNASQCTVTTNYPSGISVVNDPVTHTITTYDSNTGKVLNQVHSSADQDGEADVQYAGGDWTSDGSGDGDYGDGDGYAGGGDDGGGDYGGGDGGDDAGCVEIGSLLPSGMTAGSVKVGDVMQLADEDTLEAREGIVTYSERKKAKGYRITTRGGISLVCSDTAPLLTEEGLVLAPNVLGKVVATRRHYGARILTEWEAVETVESVGEIEVQHITVGDRCFWAGERSGAFILHHNSKVAYG